MGGGAVMILHKNTSQTLATTVQAIRNITFTNLREFVRTFSKFTKNYEFRVQSSYMNLRTKSCRNSYNTNS